MLFSHKSLSKSKISEFKEEYEKGSKKIPPGTYRVYEGKKIIVDGNHRYYLTRLLGIKMPWKRARKEVESTLNSISPFSQGSDMNEFDDVELE